ncbi:hypothetical protein HMPREF0083_06042 [Aneurinibacillus aneurinilyticus ATCC 12856]|uniref:Uncharacterized protein n=1 Tax=Aneurinibacillus aneurinilyticus ATCC 12856 TaxID=649747 RepID=U1WPH1_ANEAE|nr:hypothetical protein HMPREF0083_06042 [Aneurinibacillus aneurinilyticus ATCC 12856]
MMWIPAPCVTLLFSEKIFLFHLYHILPCDFALNFILFLPLKQAEAVFLETKEMSQKVRKRW